MSVQTVLSASRTIFDRALEVIPGGVNSSTRALDPAIIWRKANGAMMEDVDGRQYIDYHAAFGPIVLGHNDPDVNQAVVEALAGPDLMGVGTTEMRGGVGD